MTDLPYREAGKYRRMACLLAIVTQVVAGWVLVAVVGSPAGRNPFWTALALGTLFAHVTLAATWSALGPLPLMARLPLALTWLAALVIAVSLQGPPGALAIAVVISGALVAQWLIVQSPLWLLVARYGLRIRPVECMDQAAAPAEQQFGIRQLMILTAIVAVVLGIGRVALGGIQWGGFEPGKAIAAFAFLALASALVAFPLVAAALLPRGVALACVAAIGLVALTTAFEEPLFRLLSTGGSADLRLFAWMNASQCAWILGVLFLLRAAGYRLTSRASTT